MHIVLLQVSLISLQEVGGLDCRFWHNQILHCHQAPFDEMLKSHKVVGLL